MVAVEEGGIEGWKQLGDDKQKGEGCRGEWS